MNEIYLNGPFVPGLQKFAVVHQHDLMGCAVCVVGSLPWQCGLEGQQTGKKAAQANINFFSLISRGVWAKVFQIEHWNQ